MGRMTREHYPRMFKKAVQQGPSKRGDEAYSHPYVESLSVARTKPEDFFNILLDLEATDDLDRL